MEALVKLLCKRPPSAWAGYFENESYSLHGVRFTFDPSERDYDWLVVYEDLPFPEGAKEIDALEQLACPPENTILVTAEPESIKSYGYYYTRQFGHVLTSQPTWSLPHPNRTQIGAMNYWFYGDSKHGALTGQEIRRGPAIEDKCDEISMMFSPKAMRHTQHATRFAFMKRVAELMPELVLLGKGVKPIDDKREALDPFKYHITLENHISDHHITEKLPDALLGRCLTFYAGAPNAHEYFPSDSFIPINMNDPEGTVVLIRQSMREKAWEKRLPAIEEARDRVLNTHNVIAAITRLISSQPTSIKQPPQETMTLYGRHAWRYRHPWHGPLVLAEKIYVQLRASPKQWHYQKEKV